MRLRRGGLGSAGSWPCTSTGRISYKNSNRKSICREQGGGTPDRAAEALAAQRGRSGARWPHQCTVSQEPASSYGTNGLILCTVRRSTGGWQRSALLRLSTACWPTLGRCALSSHAVRVLGFRPRRPPPMHKANTADAGPELSQPASTPVLSAGRHLFQL